MAEPTAKEDYSSVIGLIAIFALIGWIGSVFYYPFTKAEIKELDRLNPAMQTVTEALNVWLGYAEIRLEPLGGSNLEIYLRQSDFASVAYPDRKEFVSSVGKTWCSSVSQAFLPTVGFRDIRSGERLASYSCTLGRASLR